MLEKLINRILLLALFSVCSGTASAHGPVDRIPEATSDYARLFAADAATGHVLVLDLPDGTEASRLMTPPFIMSLALSGDERHLYVMRGRDTDRDLITVVNTGLDVAAGTLRPPYIARTLPVDTPGPGYGNRMYSAGGKDALTLEGTGEFIIIDDDEFSGFAPVSIRKYKLGAPDHYFYLESGENLYFGHLLQGYIQVLNRDSGQEVTRIEGCPVLHGKDIDEVTGRLFYSCMRHILVIGTRGDETNQVVARIPYPKKQRIGAFLKGRGQVLWGFTEGTLPIVYRLDAAIQPYELTNLTLGASIRQWTTGDGEFLLSLTRGGVLQIRDGGTGKLLRVAEVSKPLIGEYHEDVNKAILPDIKTMDGNAYVSLPHEGRIAVVDLATAEIRQYFETGGEPTRISLVKARGKAEPLTTNPSTNNN